MYSRPHEKIPNDCGLNHLHEIFFSHSSLVDGKTGSMNFLKIYSSLNSAGKFSLLISGCANRSSLEMVPVKY